MPDAYKSYVPQTPGELIDFLTGMLRDSPTFTDKWGHFPHRTIDTQFTALKESFAVLRKQLGEERYVQLVDMADRMRAHFEADPEDKTEDGAAGRKLLFAIEDILRATPPRRAG